MLETEKSIVKKILIKSKFYFANKKRKLDNVFSKYAKTNIIFYVFLGLFSIFFIIFLFKGNFLVKQRDFVNQIIGKNISKLINITKIQTNITNIDFQDEFYNIKEVRNQIISKNLTYINTISCGNAKIGNSLIILNNVINICEKIKCKNIILPKSLNIFIKRPIVNKESNITIFPNYYKYKKKTDIYLRRKTLFWFKYKKKSYEMRLSIIREELFNNIPKNNFTKNDLVIHMRSGDIFTNNINRVYSQPPLCFYQKIIKENKFLNIYITSNGNENPVIKELLKWNPKIKFISGPLKEAISIIVYSYNFVMSVSSFSMYLINLNKNLNNLYIYKIFNYDLRNVNCTIHEMEPSEQYTKLMKYKWKKSTEQLNLLINEKCIDNKLISHKSLIYN